MAFLCTDIEGSSARWLNHRARMHEAVRAHDRLLERVVAAHRGRVFKTLGDGIYAAFARCADAIDAAVAAQRALAEHDWSAVDGLAVRMAIHVGLAHARDDDYFGVALNRSARLLALGHGGQILVSAAAARAVAAESHARHALRRLGGFALDDPLQYVDVYQVEAAGLRRDFPSLRAPVLQPSNLPQQPTALIGREDELGDVLSRLAAHALVTLTGPGGVGKTRLALEAAGRWLESRAQGVWFVDFAPLDDPTLVVGAISSALGLQLPGTQPLRQLVGRLRSQSLLLVLDNCEHLLDAVADVARALLDGGPELRILATSQEHLGLNGEQVVRVAPLPVPPAGTLTLESALDSGAVRLFVERARAADSRFGLDEHNVRSVAAICQRLDGIPLALEMAAARVPMFGVAGLARRLDERFRVLKGGWRTALPRQQTLRATLDWSYGLLAPAEQVVLRRAAIFAGGFTLDAAEAVLADAAVDGFAVTDAIARLVSRSLVAADTRAQWPRYRLLETTRAYATERLEDGEDRDALAGRHAAFYAALFEAAYAQFWTLSEPAWRDRYASERDNLRAALAWTLGEKGDARAAVALAGASAPLWGLIGLGAERRAWLERVAPHADAAPAAIAARFWHWLAASHGDAAPKDMLAALERALALDRRDLDVPTHARLLGSYAVAQAASGHLGAGHRALAEALPLAERSGSASVMAHTLDARSLLRAESGDSIGSRSDADAVLALARSAGLERLILLTLLNTADTDWTLGDTARAIAGFREAAVTMRRAPLVNRTYLGAVLGNLSGALTEQGNVDEARVVAAEAIPLLREAGLAWAVADHFALQVGAAGRLHDAARLSGWAEAAHAAHDKVRQPNEARAFARLRALLDERLAADERDRLLAIGARLTDDEACELVISACAPA